jgi:hypothetical protein
MQSRVNTAVSHDLGAAITSPAATAPCQRMKVSCTRSSASAAMPIMR